MRRVFVLIAMAGFVVPACGGGGGGSSATRTILTDYNYDRFNTSYFAFFPRFTPVHPGDTIVFKQAWSGDAHTVSFGRLLDPISEIAKPYYQSAKPPTGDEFDQASQAIPFPFDGENVNQTAGQPCYLQDGPLRADRKACPRVAQPAFTGREAFYSSGFIPYEGNDGNKFTMKLSATIKQGDYFYYCLMHGPSMGGYLEVRPPTQAVPSQSELSRTALKELATATRDLTKAHRDALAKKWDLPPGTPKVDILAGAISPETSLTFGLVDEYYPKKFVARVGQKVTWMIQGHTVSFHVPKYGPQLIFNPKTHEVLQNLKAYNPARVTVPQTTPDNFNEPPPPVDAGLYDGSKFLSSGVQFGTAFSVTFTKPGTYQYACTIHPRQVGTLVVKG